MDDGRFESVRAGMQASEDTGLKRLIIVSCFFYLNSLAIVNLVQTSPQDVSQRIFFSTGHVHINSCPKVLHLDLIDPVKTSKTNQNT